MSEAPIQLPLCWGAHGSTAVPTAEARQEARSEEVRIVEYCPFPRASAAQGRRLGFTRDLSASGLCLEVDREHAVGSLLRLTLRSIDGRPTLEALARVAWCRRDGGSIQVGLSFIDDARDAAGPAAAPEPLRPGPRPARLLALRRIA